MSSEQYCSYNYDVITYTYNKLVKYSLYCGKIYSLVLLSVETGSKGQHSLGFSDRFSSECL